MAGDPAARRDAGLFLIEGLKLAGEALRLKFKIRQAVLAPDCRMRDELLKSGVDLLELGDKAFAAVAGTESPQGVILVLELPRPALLPDSKISLAVAAEKLQDPGNLGTLLRSAWACAADAVFLSPGCADAFAPKTVRAAAGAQLHLAIETQIDLGRRLTALASAGVQIFALEPQAKSSLWDADLTKATCFVVGSEGQGLSASLLKTCSKALRLDTPGKAESLNAGVSISIALFEALRQRKNS